MEGINFFEIVLTIGVSVGGWVLRTLWDSHRNLETKVNAHQMENNDRFVRRDDWRSELSDIKSMLDKIFNRLDQKVDKP